MAKRKKGRPRGRNGGSGFHARGGYRQHSARPYQPSVGNGENRNAEPADNGEPGPVEPGSGVLELHPNGYGFLRDPTNNYMREMTDPFVPGSMIEKYGLREGVLIHGMVQAGRRQQGPRLREITDVDGMPPDDYKNVKSFDQLTADQPGILVETGGRPRADDHPRDGPLDAAGQGAAGVDRLPSAPARPSSCSTSAWASPPTSPKSS